MYVRCLYRLPNYAKARVSPRRRTGESENLRRGIGESVKEEDFFRFSGLQFVLSAFVSPRLHFSDSCNCPPFADLLSPKDMTPQDKLRKIREELQQLFLERAELIDGALAALLSAQHVLVIGPPGTAKSMLADELCRRISGAAYFQWLLTKFTTPEELFGAVSLKALEADDYRRVTSNKLPEAHIAFLDEVFKASSSILNAILTIINERLFHNGRQVTQVPLLTLFGASNELPEDDELLALYDRFLLRFVVGYIGEDFRFLKMLQAKEPAERTTITLDELCQMQAEAQTLAMPTVVLRGIADIRRELQKKNLIASDRRYRQSL